MTSIQPCELPETALLRKYLDGKAYADCYTAEVDGQVSQAEFIEVFYTTTLFKVERFILRHFAARPSTDAEAKQLAEGTSVSFAAWQVESRNADQLLLADFSGRTRSWLMTVPVSSVADGPRTQLYFGSAVVPRASAKSERPRMGLAFHALLGFHRLYSKLLLGAARSRILARRSAGVSTPH